MIIDTHLHVWDLDRSPYSWLGPQVPQWNRTFAFDEVAPQLEQNGVDAVVLVQADDDDRDTDLMLEVAAARPEVVGVVAYIPLERPAEAAARLEVLQANPYVVGIRNLTHDRADPDWVLRPDVDETLSLIEQAGLKLETIDVMDLALGSLAARVIENENQSAALLYLRAGGGIIVLTKGDTLYFARHFDFSLEALNDVERQDSVIQHLALEVQRSFDYFDSQMAQVPPKVLHILGPTPNLPLANMLGGSIAAQVQIFDSTLCFGEQRKMTQDEIYAFAAMGSALTEVSH